LLCEPPLLFAIDCYPAQRPCQTGPVFSDLFPGGDLSRQTAETLPAFLNFNRSSSLLRRSLVIQSRGWKLQHGSSLAGNQVRNLHNLAVREFKRIVMRVWIGHIDLTKPRDLVIYRQNVDPVVEAVAGGSYTHIGFVVGQLPTVFCSTGCRGFQIDIEFAMWGDSFDEAMHRLSDVVTVVRKAVEGCEKMA